MSKTPIPARSAQPQREALTLGIKDEARKLRLNLQHGAHWLLRDFQESAGIAEQASGAGGKQATRLQHLVHAAAQTTSFVFESAQDAAAAVIFSDAPYRRLHFQLLPLASYFRATDDQHPSRLFTNVVYWLIRHALKLRPVPSLMVRQQAVDEAYWMVLARVPALLARLRATSTDDDAANLEQNLELCVALLQALLQAQPVHDAGLPPWVERDLAETETVAVLASLLTVVASVGLAASALRQGRDADASGQLQLAAQMVNARWSEFASAVGKANAQEALAAELAFVFRHA